MKTKQPFKPISPRRAILIFVSVMIIAWVGGISILHFGFDLSFDEIFDIFKKQAVWRDGWPLPHR